MSAKKQDNHLDEVQGDGEQQTESYLNKTREQSQSATQQSAKSTNNEAGLASRSVSAMRGSRKVPIVAIVGRANVGKSSLFNAVIGKREAIVAQEAGTTRDNVTAKATYEGKDFWLVDTAGLKSAEDEFELTIQEQITEATAAADVILVTVEADVPITDEDRRVAKMALKSKKAVILVVNKIDKNRKAKLEEWQRLGIKPILATSVPQKHGINELLDEVANLLPKARIKEDTDRISMALARPSKRWQIQPV
jgi:GTP-binding protein